MNNFNNVVKLLDSIFVTFQFGKKWFRPEEASDLRKKIRAILMDEFQNAFKSGHISDSSSLSSGGDPP
jgi:ubiquitin-like-specific protease 1C/D